MQTTCTCFSSYLAHISALTLCIFQHLPCAYFSTYLVVLQNDYCFLLIKHFLYKMKIGFFDPKVIEKTLATKWTDGCLLQNTFHNPCYNPKSRPWFWFVCVGPSTMLWKFTVAYINILHKSQRSCRVSCPLILLCFYYDTVQHFSICERTSLYTPRLIDIKPTEQRSLAVIRCFGTLDRAIAATHDFARKEVTFLSNDRISASRVSRSLRFLTRLPPGVKNEEPNREFFTDLAALACETAKLKSWWKSNSSERLCIILGTSLFFGLFKGFSVIGSIV